MRWLARHREQVYWFGVGLLFADIVRGIPLAAFALGSACVAFYLFGEVTK